MRSVFLRIVGFVLVIDLFYMGIGRLYLTQSEEHPAPELQITVATDVDTLVGMGESLLRNKGGCLLCHKISEVGNTRGPDLRGVGGRAAIRQPGMSAEAYLLESLREPSAYVVEEFATPGGESIMPAADRPPADLSPTELKALVAYLQSLSGEITVRVTEGDVAAAEARKQAKPTPVSTDPGFGLLAARGCVACHDVSGTERRVGPPLTDVGERLTAAEIRESIVDPNAVIAEGYQKDLMLKDFAETLSTEELDQLVSYLSGEVGLTERLAHPGIHLLAFILLFNGGVLWASRKAESLGDATDSSRSSDVEGESSSWKRGGWLFLVALVVLAGILYVAFQGREPEPPTPQPEPESAAEIPSESGAAARLAVPVVAGVPDGAALFKVTCPACHGQDAKGVPGLGKDMTNSEFIRARSDDELIEFIKLGRAIDDPLNTTGVAMPPKGLNTALTDDDLRAIVEFIRSLSK
jgi:disulfide bond formation protein DsbB